MLTRNRTSRRHFIAGSSVAALSTLLLDSSTVASTKANNSKRSPRSLDDALPSQSLSVGYWQPQTLPFHSQIVSVLNSSNSKFNQGNFRTDSSESVLVDTIRHDASGIAPFAPDIVRAEDINAEEALADSGLKVSLLGVYTPKRDWHTGDKGTFLVKIKFDEYTKCCDKISSATFGSSLEAVKDDLATITTGITLFDKITIKDAKALTLSFDLINVTSDRDKSLVKTILDAVSKLGPLSGILGATGIATPYLLAGSTILDALGVHLLQDPAANHQIWESKVEVSLETKVAAGVPKPRLRTGLYVIGGNSKYTGGASPAWGLYQLRGPDPGNTGSRRYLFRKDAAGNLIPADFNYVLLAVEPASS